MAMRAQNTGRFHLFVLKPTLRFGFSSDILGDLGQFFAEYDIDANACRAQAPFEARNRIIRRKLANAQSSGRCVLLSKA
jgi:hypothetical protein